MPVSVDVQPPVVLYQRLSDQPGHKQSCAVQERHSRDYCQRNDLDPVASFTDDGISGWKSGAVRPGYAAMLAYLHANPQVRGVVSMHSSRVTRNRVERAQFVDDLGRNRGVWLYCTQGMAFDLSTAQGRTFFVSVGEQDTHESERKSELVKDEQAERRMSGKAAAFVAFGWRRVTETNSRGKRIGWHDVIDEPAADVVREIVAGIIVGEPIIGIVRSLNERKIPTPREAGRLGAGAPFVGAGRWIAASVRELAMRPANAGQLTYKGEVFGRADAPALIDTATHEQVVAILRNPARRTTRAGSRRHLLTYSPALAQCGRCGSALHVLHHRGVPKYTCGAHQHVGRDLGHVDGHVAAVVLAWCGQQRNRVDADATNTRLAKALDALRVVDAELDQLRDLLAAGRLTPAQVADRNDVLLPLQAGARADVAAASQPGVADALNVTAAMWQDMTVAHRRQVLTALGVRVTLLPSKLGKGFDPDSVRVEFA